MPPTETTQMNEVSMPKKAAVGPTAAVVIIVLLLIVGAFYFWGAQLSRQRASAIPYIPGDSTTTQQ